MFSCACWPSVCFLWENLYWDLLPIFNQVVLFFWYWIISTVYIFWILTLIGYIIFKYFLSFSRLYFCFVDVPLLCRSLGQVVIVQSWSHVQLFETLWLWTAACEASLFFTIFKSLLKLMSIELVALLLFMPSIIPSIRVFSNESALWIRWPGMGASVFPSIKVFSKEQTLSIRWTKSWSFSFSNSPSNEYLGFISFRID